MLLSGRLSALGVGLQQQEVACPGVASHAMHTHTQTHDNMQDEGGRGTQRGVLEFGVGSKRVSSCV